MSIENPNDPIGGMTDGRDDPNRGPIDRAANAVEGRDDPNKGPIDRAQNALGGRDDPNKVRSTVLPMQSPAASVQPQAARRDPHTGPARHRAARRLLSLTAMRKLSALSNNCAPQGLTMPSCR